jgi:hypothetical protein
MSIDYSKAGKRIKLANGDLGTILYRFEDHGSWCIAVKWNSGSTLSLIEGVDRYEIIDEEKSNSNDRKEERDRSKHVT